MPLSKRTADFPCVCAVGRGIEPNLLILLQPIALNLLRGFASHFALDRFTEIQQ